MRACAEPAMSCVTRPITAPRDGSDSGLGQDPCEFVRSVPTIDSQHESARFSVPIVARRNSDGLIIDAVKNIIDAQRRAPVRIDLITGAKVDHSEGALHLPKILLRNRAISE